MSFGSPQNQFEPTVTATDVDQSAAVARPGAVPTGLIDSILEAATEEPATRLSEFLATTSSAEALRVWLRWTGWTRPIEKETDRDELVRFLARAVAQIDVLLAAQVNAVLHHPDFQRLEASWRGLYYLVEQRDDGQRVKIRVLSISRRELSKDLERAIEFDQSLMFKKIYENEFGTPGGEPYGLLIGDYEFSGSAIDSHLLGQLSSIAAASFAPFVAAANPAMFGLEQFTQLERPLNLSRTFEQLDYLKWRALRDQEDSRFVALALPRVLMRLPYDDDGSRVDNFVFREDVAGPDRTKYLWGNAAYAFGAVVLRAFARSGWLADIRGVQRDVEGGGLVLGLPVHSFSTDRRGVAPKSSTEVAITDQQEQELAELGFIPLCHCHGTENSAFYASPSIQKSKRYDDMAATLNARISAMLPYMLCASRFAHYLKVIARDKIGSFSEASECEAYLHQWLQQYVTSDAEASPQVKAELPLREARVRVVPHPGRPGSYLCTAHLWPHFELDELTASVKISTELTPGHPH